MSNVASPQPMGRYSGMSPRARRAWGIGLIAFFILLCAMIGFSEWWAYHVNVPAYEARMHQHAH